MKIDLQRRKLFGNRKFDFPTGVPINIPPPRVHTVVKYRLYFHDRNAQIMNKYILLVCTISLRSVTQDARARLMTICYQ